MADAEVPVVVVRPGQPFISCPHCHSATATGTIGASSAQIVCTRCGAPIKLVVDRPKA